MSEVAMPWALTHPVSGQTLAFGLDTDNSLDSSFPVWPEK